ncbi:hypothetical protein B0H14DRAFT_2611734 [Mycena olivaceomarginata]|nr:hypothetical protein B0H14DRAFT_2611734 [Mycena olivaceomarginata]
MPANDQTTRTSACGLPLPLPADFDFRAYRKTPSELVAPDDMSLREKNADKLPFERANETSSRLTRAYEAAAGSSAGVGDRDVGTRLRPSFSFLDEEKVLLVASKDVVDADASPTTTPSARAPTVRPWANGWARCGPRDARESRMTFTPTTSPNSNTTPPSSDSALQVKEDSVAPVVLRNNGSNGSNRPRTTRSIFGKLIISMLNGSRQSITAFSPVIAAAPHLTTTLHTDTSSADSASVKTSGAQSTLWTRDDVLEPPAPPLIPGA